jgi:hypothetical protein
MGGIKDVLSESSMEIDNPADADFGDNADEAGDGDKVVPAKGKAAAKEEPKPEAEETDDAAEEEEADETDGASKGEESDDAAGAAAKAAAKNEKDLSKQKVPYHRMQAQVEARKEAERRALEAERRLAELEGTKGNPDPVKERQTELGDLYEKVEELRVKGESKEAARVQRQIDEIKDEISEIKAERVAQKHSAAAAQKAAYDAFVEEVELKLPELDPDNDHFDADVYDEVTGLTKDFLKAGYSPKKALQKALALAVPEERLTGKSAVKEEPKKDVAAERKQGAVKKAIDTVKKQPASTNGLGKDSTKSAVPDVSRMSQDEFEKLPEATQARLRGDEL